LEPGNYTVTLTVTNNGKCEDVKTVYGLIKVYEIPIAEFYPNPYETIVDQGVITFSNESVSSESLLYNWDFGDGNTSEQNNPDHIYNQVGVFLVKLLVETSNGCINRIEKEVVIHPDAQVFPPNAFTPDGDGINDIFEIKGVGIKKYNVKIFSRWGELVFESNNIEEHWDGRINGQIVPKGSYAYQIAYTSVLDKNIYKRGTVTVIY